MLRIGIKLCLCSHTAEEPTPAASFFSCCQAPATMSIHSLSVAVLYTAIRRLLYATTVYTVSYESKNIPSVISRSLAKHCLILIIYFW